MQGWGQVHRYLYLPVLEYIFRPTRVYIFILRDLLSCRVGAKYIGTCTYLYLSTFFRVLACTMYLSFKNVLEPGLEPKYITKYLLFESKYIASTPRFVKKYIL